MSKIPKGIQRKITEQAKLYGTDEGPALERMIEEGTITFGDLQNACEVDFEAGAEWGYSLSLERIGELEKEVERVKEILKKQAFGCDCTACTIGWQDFKKENKL